MNRSAYAFTLIELLVVMSIIATLSSLIIFSFEETEKDKVRKSAEELQSVLERARTLSISTGNMHGVSFHIENAGDGSVLKNFSDVDGAKFPGRHWYCIIGPDSANIDGRSSYYPPICTRGNDDDDSVFYALDSYVDAVKSAQIGPRHYLQRGVRFLALGDEEELFETQSQVYDDPTYPRPWFGFYDDTNNIYYPWGAYNPAIDLNLPNANTGLDYEGEDGPIAYDAELDTNINPAEVWGRVTKDATAHHQEFIDDGVEDYSHKLWYLISKDYVGPDTAYLASTGGRKVPRPLVNAYWCDAMVMFNARGEALWSFPQAREWYFRTVANGNRYNTRNDSFHNAGREDMGIKHHDVETGGFYITLCRDVVDSDMLYTQTNAVTGQMAYNQFNSVEDALESITPFIRVYVNRLTGKAEVRDEAYPQSRIEPADLLGHDPYPRGY